MAPASVVLLVDVTAAGLMTSGPETGAAEGELVVVLHAVVMIVLVLLERVAEGVDLTSHHQPPHLHRGGIQT